LLSRTLRALHIRSTTHDQLVISVQDRINEEIAIRNELEEIRAVLSSLNPSQVGVYGCASRIKGLIKRMNDGRLRLYDKHAPERVMVSNPKAFNDFDFTKFTGAEVAHLMRAGHNAALKALRQLGLSTSGLPLIEPTN